MLRFGPPPLPGISYRNRAGAYALILRGNRLLLTDQQDQGEINLPGGGIDPGEGALRALARECMEETGWTIRVVRRLGAYQRYTYMPDYHGHFRKVCHIFLAIPVRRVGEPTEQGHRAIWVSPAQATGCLASPGDRAFAALLA